MNGDAKRLTVHAPVDGWCLPLSEVPDAVFRERLLGDGVAIDPTGNTVRAPFDGVVTNVADAAHAITVAADDCTAVLIHVGVDTVELGGRGFDLHVEVGARVKRGDALLSFDMDVLARHAPSLVTPVVLMARDHAVLGELGVAGPVAAGEPLFEVVAVAPVPAPGAREPAPHDQWSSTAVRVTLPHGLHARPAAMLAKALRALDAVVRCRDAADRVADARSPVAMLSLGIRADDRVVLEATGADADAALRTAAESLGEEAPRQAAAVAPVAGPAPRPGDVLRGQRAVGGLAAGTAVPFSAQQVPVRHEVRDAADERLLFRDALGEVRRYLDGFGESGTAREIAAAHAAFLDDPELIGDVENLIGAGDSAPRAWQQAIERAAAGLEALEDSYLGARAADLRDVGRRVQRVLAGQDAADTVTLAEASIVVADDLLPTQLIEIDRERVAGICLGGGGQSSHVAILAASFDIPMIVGAGRAVAAIGHGTELLLDADAGELTLAADGAAAARFRERIAAARARRRDELAAAHAPCRTRDGGEVAVFANLAATRDAHDAVAHGADGCGLLRTEFLFMGRATAPAAAEQTAAFQAIADALGERPLVVRALDAGGDKPLAFVRCADEANPALGVRGIRLLLEEPALLESQYDALLAVRHRGALKLMLPMVAFLGEIRRARELLERARERAGGGRVELGIMIETPAAALTADRLAPHVDFFSIGTNDLCQYALAMDRGAAALAGSLDPLHPAVLRLIDAATRAADGAGRPVSVCGSAAADPAVAAVLLGLGIRQLSVVPAAVPRVKAAIRTWSLAGCRELATRALDSDAAGEVREQAAAFVAAANEPPVGDARAAT